MKQSSFLFGIIVLCLFLTTSVSAITWTSAGGCYTYSTGSTQVVMWNTTGTHIFYAPGVTSSTIKYLIVAGGASGGSSPAWGSVSGGGGAGGLLQSTSYTQTSDTFTIVVGSKGNRQTTDLTYGNNGGDSALKIDSTWINATGGGGGAAYNGGNYPPNYGRNGGSGGGGAAIANPGNGISGQGYNGGTGQAGSPYAAGGGGGAGGLGTSQGTGQGGIGVSNNITTEYVLYAVGGNGGQNATTASTNAAGGYGYGGHGSTGGGGDGGAGTDGVVIIQYEIPLDPPVVDFTIQLVDNSTNAPSSWQWNVTNLTGNNTPVTFSTSQSPTLTIGVGNWLIELIATNIVGSSTNKYNKTVGINLSSPIVYYWNRTS